MLQVEAPHVGRMEWENVKPAPGRLVVVQRFVNTRTYLTGGDLLADAEEEEEEEEEATAWLTEHGLLGAGERLDEAGRRRLLAFREVLRGLLVTHNGGAGADVQALNDLVASTALKVAFESDGRLALVVSGEGGPADRVLGRLLVVMAKAEAEGTWKRLKVCHNENCRWAFYDASKNRSGSWCNMAVCGARHKMRTYRQRKLESP